MKRVFLLSSLAVLGVSLTLTAVNFGGQKMEAAEASTGNYTTNASTYYSGITATSGTKLLGQLHDLMCKTHKTYTTYNDCKDPTSVYKADPGTSSSYVRDFYTEHNISKAWGSGAVGTWNREHVWCQSLSNNLWGTTGGGSDLHHLRPTETTLNSTRNNHPYGEVSSHNSTTTKYAKDTNKNYITSYVGGYVEGDCFEPVDGVKGDVARILMYVYTHYTTYTKISGTTNGSGSSSYFGSLNITSVVTTSKKTESAAWALLLKWNQMDPVDSVERTRNEAVAKMQGNRNPFIDNSSYANAIWGNGTVSPTNPVDPTPVTPTPTDPTPVVTTKTTTIKYSDTFSPKLPTVSGSVNTSATTHTDTTVSIKFAEKGIYKASSANYIMFYKNKGYIYNTESLGKISKIAITYSSGTSTSGKIGVYFSSGIKSSYTTTSNATIAGRSTTQTFSSSAGYGYFQISTSGANVQITNIAITYTK